MNVPTGADLAHLINDHGLTVRDIAVLFRCRDDLVRDLVGVEPSTSDPTQSEKTS